MKIIVTSSCFIAERGTVGRSYAEGEIIDASEGLAKEFFSHSRARQMTDAEFSEIEKLKASVVETAAMAPDKETATVSPAKQRKK